MFVLFSIFLDVFAEIDLFKVTNMVKFGFFDDFVKLLRCELVGFELLEKVFINPEVLVARVHIGGN
jgi:hypothetical protein